MKVLFICGSLESGKDGVGDYTKKMALMCKEYGIKPLIIAINDKYIDRVQSGYVDNIPFFRIPEIIAIKDKVIEVKKIIVLNTPIDWISLQFVSYSFSNKGLIYKYIKPLKLLFSGFKVHIMMHELWVGEEREASFKNKYLGYLQKIFVINLLKSIKPLVVNTSIPLYKHMLENAGINVSILPLFSNINYPKINDDKYLETIPDDIVTNKNNYIIGCVFGSIYHASWDMASLFHLLEKKSKSDEKKILIISVGKISTGEEFWKELPLKYPNFRFLTIGIQDETVISNLMYNFVDFGIVTTPAIIAGKSGTYMAFLEHGLPVFSKKNELSFNFDTSDCLLDERLTIVDESYDMNFQAHSLPISLINKTIEIFVETLKSNK
ncbi:hypothetical protein [Mucilaginibacter sp.]